MSVFGTYSLDEESITVSNGISAKARSEITDSQTVHSEYEEILGTLVSEIRVNVKLWNNRSLVFRKYNPRFNHDMHSKSESCPLAASWIIII